MRIFIDSTFFIVYKWENGKRGDTLLNYFGQHNAISFSSFIEKILSPSQFNEYVGGIYDQVYRLSKKRELVMFEQIEILKKK